MVSSTRCDLWLSDSDAIGSINTDSRYLFRYINLIIIQSDLLVLFTLAGPTVRHGDSPTLVTYGIFDLTRVVVSHIVFSTSWSVIKWMASLAACDTMGIVILILHTESSIIACHFIAWCWNKIRKHDTNYTKCNAKLNFNIWPTYNYTQVKCLLGLKYVVVYMCKLGVLHTGQCCCWFNREP